MVMEQPAATKQKGSIAKWVILIIIIIIVVLGGIFVYFSGRDRLEEAYHAASQSAYNEIYQAAFQFAEEKNHVSNDVNISVEGAREVSRLEVLAVSGSEYVIKNADKTSKVTSWLEVQGTGIFTVDLAAGEFIADSDRHYVLVRVPQPKLTECKISGTGKQFWKNGWIIANGSVAEGVRLSQAQLGEGKLKLEDSIKQNRRFHEAAQESTIRMIESLVREWNPNVEDLQITVAFIDDF